MKNIHRLRFVFAGRILLFLSLFTIKSLACGLDWTVPTNHFDGINEQGNLSYWEGIGDLDLGKGLKIPLVVNFNSARNSSSPYLGSGWILALLDASLVQIDDKRFLMVQPDGWITRFGRKQVTDTTINGQKGWMGQINGNQVTVWAECGWKMVFTEGKISSITTPQNDELTYVYRGGIVKEIDKNGTPILSVDVDPTTGQVQGLSFNGNRIVFEQGQKPLVENLNGKNVIGEVKSSLQKLTLADGLVETYKYSVNSTLLPTLDVSGIFNRSFVWDPVTHLLLQDGIWTYKIVPAQTLFTNAEITRTNSLGQSEYWHDDAHIGQKISQGLDAVKHIEESFTTGLLAGKLRKVEEIKDGITTIVRSVSYDEQGRVLIDIKKDFANTTYTYDDANSTRTRIIEYKNGVKQTTIWKDKIITSDTQVIKGVTSQVTNTGKI